MSRMHDRRLSPSDAARILGKSRESVMELIHAGEIEATNESQPGSNRPRYRIDPSALDRWRASRRVQPSTVVPGKMPQVVRVAGVISQRLEAKRRKRLEAKRRKRLEAKRRKRLEAAR